MITLEQAMAEVPVVAIIRGVRPEEVEDQADALFQGGIRIVEVPLNSPEPLDSIGRLASAWGERLVCGAGTVLNVEAAEAVSQAGGRIMVSPDTRPAVIRRAVELGMVPMPGVGTATEVFQAYDAGARHLKLFPASTYGPGHIKALKAVLPTDAVMLAVGGAGPSNMAEWWAAGARGFGLGSELYKPGQTPQETFEKAKVCADVARELAAGVEAPRY
jgi:2-dehydro-3-deoxyphosphogalactonate aldolase